MEQLYTRWKTEADFEHPENTPVPLPEYPRPQMRREEYQVLNGIWSYAITGEDRRPDAWDGKILVPFSPETALSGVGRTLEPGSFLHYERSFGAVPPSPGARLLLHFGAVDQRCHVRVNGKEAGSHEGGFTAFSMDVTDLLREGENSLEVICRDDTDTSWQGRGKQKLEPGGMFYHAQSGIWKTVWTEWVPALHIRSLSFRPRFEERKEEILVEVSGGEAASAAVTVTGPSGQESRIIIQTGERVLLDLPGFRPWSPEDPFLYRISISVGEDTVKSYFALRSFESRRDRKGILRFFLNGRPCYMNGLLDQGYWPESLLTQPSDRALSYDIKVLKSLGFNMIRKHIKVESARFYYHCDRLGMLVWQDMINGGTSYNMNFVTYLPTILPWVQRHTRDMPRSLLSRTDEKGREAYMKELDETMEELKNAVSLCVWVPFNEGWGQFDAAAVTDYVRRKDPDRLIDQASGWFDQGGGDFYSVHNYFRRLKAAPKERIFGLTEFGGITLNVEGHSAIGDRKVYGYKHFKTEKELEQGYERMMRTEILPNIRRGLSASVLTQTSDVETEINGLLTWDREVLKIPAGTVRRLNRLIQKEFERQTEGDYGRD